MKSTNTKDEQIEEIVSDATGGLSDADWVKKYGDTDYKQLLAKDRQQLLQRVREEVIGNYEQGIIRTGGVYDSKKEKTRNDLRQTQREILENMEKEL